MRSVKSLIAAGAASLLSSAAFAADMPIAAASDVRAAGRRRFRRLVSARRYRLQQSAASSSDTPGYHDPGITVASSIGHGFDTAGIFGLGVGYQFNNWFRADVTGEYRGKAQLPRHRYRQLQRRRSRHRRPITRSKSEWVVLANAYVDLGTWWCMTPFIGAGVGGVAQSRSRTSSTMPITARTVCGVAFAAERFEVEFRLGAACRCRLQGHARTSRSNSPIATRSSATASPATLTDLRRHQRAAVNHAVQGHHLAGPQARRALGSAAARRSTRRRR